MARPGARGIIQAPVGSVVIAALNARRGEERSVRREDVPLRQTCRPCFQVPAVRACAATGRPSQFGVEKFTLLRDGNDIQQVVRRFLIKSRQIHRPVEQRIRGRQRGVRSDRNVRPANLANGDLPVQCIGVVGNQVIIKRNWARSRHDLSFNKKNSKS